jgi:uncharacterized protein involved in cysteine biosynthesis
MLLQAPLRALAQFDDPAFLGVAWRSVVASVLALAALTVALVWGGAAALGDHGWLGWLGGLLGGVGAVLLAHYLFLPLATLVAFLFVDRVATAVERRFYAYLRPAQPAPLLDQTLDGLALGARVLAWQILALVLLLTPLAPVASPLGWLVAAWSVGRGLYVAVAMRRMDRAAATRDYRARRGSVVFIGALMALGSLVPLLNLFVPVLGAAAMTHLLHGDDARAGRW